MILILLGAAIEAAGFIIFIIGTSRHGFPPGAAWLISAIALVLAGNGCVLGTILARIIANRKN